MKVITIQHKEVLKRLLEKGSYKANKSFVSKNLLKPYEFASTFFGWDNIPIFLAPIGYKVEMYGAKMGSDYVAIELDIPKETVLPYGNGYLHNGWQYRMTENEICALERQNVKTGEIEVIAEQIVCFVMDETAVYLQPYYTENTETKSVGGVSRTNRSKGQILRYDLKTGETTELLNDPTLHLEEKLYLQDSVLMVRMYGTVVDPMDGTKCYDVLPHALFFKNGEWRKVEYDG